LSSTSRHIAPPQRSSVQRTYCKFTSSTRHPSLEVAPTNLAQNRQRTASYSFFSSSGVVVIFDFGERFPRPRSQQRGSLRPRAWRVAVLGVSAIGGRPLPLTGSGGVTPGNFFEIFLAKSRVWGQFGTENKLIEGQPNEYDVICRNASALAFHLWPTIFAGAPFRLQNICGNGVPPRSRTTTPLERPDNATVARSDGLDRPMMSVSSFHNC